jgi:hypothetical protein
MSLITAAEPAHGQAQSFDFELLELRRTRRADCGRALARPGHQRRTAVRRYERM